MQRDTFEKHGLCKLYNGTISTPVYRELHKAVTAIALQFTGEPESARDMASEYLIALWEKCEKETVNTFFSVRPEVVKKYCEKMQRAILADLKSQEQAAAEWIKSTTNDEQVISEYINELLLLTNHLEPIQKQVGELSLVHLFTLQEIAAIVNKSYTTVKSLRGLAVYHLKRILHLKQNGTARNHV